MNNRNLTDAQITAALRAYLPAQAAAGLQGRVAQAIESTAQQRPLPSFLGTLADADPMRRRRSLLIAAALLLALALATAAAAGALQLLRGNKVPQLDLTPPSDVPAFVLSSHDQMPDLPPVAITTLTDGSVKGRIYVDRSGAVRFEHYATPDAPEPDTYEILNDNTVGQLEIVGSTKEWVEPGGLFAVGNGAIREDPRVFLLVALDGGGAVNQPGCGLTRNGDDVGDGTAASGWTYVGIEYVVGRPTFHVTCDGGDLWIDVQTRLILRSRGPAQEGTDLPVDGQPVPVPSQVETIEVTDLQLGEQPADLFEIAQPAGVAAVSVDAYACQIDPTACSTPSAETPYTAPPGASAGPLPSLPPSRASNGWIAYSTAAHLAAGAAALSGSDIYVAREAVEPRLIASQEGGTTRNLCPAFSPDGTKLAFGAEGPQGRAVVVLGLDADGVVHDPVSIRVPGSGPPPCPRWSSGGTRVAYLDGGRVLVRGLDGSTPAAEAGDPSVKDFDLSYPLLSPSGAWTVGLDTGCQMVLAKPDGTAAHVFALSYCPYAIAAWSPDGRQVLLMEDVSGEAFRMNAVGVDSLFEVTIVPSVSVDSDPSWPGWGDVSWQPVFP